MNQYAHSEAMNDKETADTKERIAIAESLFGILSDDVTLEESQSERLEKSEPD